MQTDVSLSAVLQGRGKIIYSDNEIVFDKVPIVTPNGTLNRPLVSTRYAPDLPHCLQEMS